MHCSVKEIRRFIDPDGLLAFYGNDDLAIDSVSSLDNASEYSITWIKPGSDVSSLDGRKNVLFVCNYQSYEQARMFENENAFLIAAEPRYLFSKIVNHFFDEQQSGIHPTAVVHPDAVIGENCFIGPFSYIGNAVIGNGVSIHGNSFIYDRVRIGNNVTI